MGILGRLTLALFGLILIATACEVPGVGHSTQFVSGASTGVLPGATEPPPTTTTTTTEPVDPETKRVEDMIESYFGPDTKAAKAIAWCESGYRVDVISRTNDYGLFQINGINRTEVVADLGYTMQDMLKLEPNVAVAHLLFERRGWRPWSCARKLGFT